MLDVAVSIKAVTPWPLAAVRRRSTISELATTIVSSPVWTLVDSRGDLKATNQTVVVYHGGEMAFSADDEFEFDVGILLEEPFDSDGLLKCVMTPDGRAAHARLLGDYDQLPQHHATIRRWCADTGNPVTGLHWEHYSHWHEVAERRVTDVYYLLREID